jgi:phosphohistidine swiveling domain-containing protein
VPGQRDKAISRLADVDLLLGGVNLNQDLHFSTFYLRASLSSTTANVYPGYSSILAIYEEGVERYFIAEREAEHTAKWLINRCVSNPIWLAEKLKAIETGSRKLVEAFPCNTTAETLRSARTEDLVAIYRRHNSVHSGLYRYARIPEALDRGLPFFSDYLKDFLESGGITQEELPVVFEALTTPRASSVIEEEERAFADIAAIVLASSPEFLNSHTPQMFLTTPIREALAHHREQWGWLSYHGYRNRALPNEDAYIRRMCATLIATKDKQPCELGRDAARVTDVLASLGGIIDTRHKKLFNLYSEIGRVKLHRRYLQLRNFYFLDLLLAEFAHRLNVTEWEVRCCFPEELLTALRVGHIDASIRRRLHRCGVIYSSEGEFVLEESEITSLLRTVRIKKRTNDDPNKRYGTPACIGFARGTARIVGQSGNELPFQNGDVLICMAADPDLVPMIRRAAAMVTQEGGVTSHASVLCREIGVPTVIGVEDLLDFVTDGDEVEVDATRGMVRLIRETPQQIGKGLVVPREFWDQPEHVGRKAANLQVAIKRGFRVPAYTLLSFEDTVRMLREDEGFLRKQLLALSATLDSKPNNSSSFLLRSGATNEDDERGSRAGTYFSVQFSIASDPVVAVREFVERNGRVGYNGVILLQRFVSATISGVSIDGDPLAVANHKLVVEFVRGPFNTVTSGQGQIQRFIYDHISSEILLEAGEEKTAAAIAELSLGGLVEWLSSVGRAFGRPVCAEWGYYAGNHWLYQVRGAISETTKHSMISTPTVQ